MFLSEAVRFVMYVANIRLPNDRIGSVKMVKSKAIPVTGRGGP
jgi:hypothetical protein